MSVDLVSAQSFLKRLSILNFCYPLLQKLAMKLWFSFYSRLREVPTLSLLFLYFSSRTLNSFISPSAFIYLSLFFPYFEGKCFLKITSYFYSSICFMSLASSSRIYLAILYFCFLVAYNYENMGTADTPFSFMPFVLIALFCYIAVGKQVLRGSLMLRYLLELILSGFLLEESLGVFILEWQKWSAMEEQNQEIRFLLGSQQKTLSFLEQLFLEQYSHIYLSRMPRAALFSIISFLIPNNRTNSFYQYHRIATATSTAERQSVYLIIIEQMGNNACCEQQAKAGDLISKPNFNVSKINVQPNNKLSTINFSDPPKSMKLIHQTLKPELEKESRMKESKMKDSVTSPKSNKNSRELKEQARQKYDQLPILSKTDMLRSVQKEYPKKSVQVKLVETLQNIPEVSKSLQEQSNKLEQRPAQQEQISEREAEQLRKTNLLAPQLNAAVKSTLQAQNIYVKLNPAADLKRYDNQFYQGELDTTKKFPNGFGKFYKEDESLYVGEFKMGKAHGKGAFIFSNGSYYQGEFKNNLADGEKGKYKSKELQYEGEFKNNKFHGKGKEKGANHSYQGEYYQGNKTYGTLAWTTGKQQFEYFGTFQSNKFNGYGTLKEPNGVYKGQFIKGKKHGNGTYSFNNGLRYQGQYREGQRTGRGILYNPNNKVAYDGYFQKGLPHGQGSIFDSNGKRMSTKWIQGIDSDLF